jgi:hypothetical protein
MDHGPSTSQIMISFSWELLEDPHIIEKHLSLSQYSWTSGTKLRIIYSAPKIG